MNSHASPNALTHKFLTSRSRASSLVRSSRQDIQGNAKRDGKEARGVTRLRHSRMSRSNGGGRDLEDKKEAGQVAHERGNQTKNHSRITYPTSNRKLGR